MKKKLIVYWSRRDFRLSDNPALTRALEESRAKSIPLLPLFILEDYMTKGGVEHQFGYPQRYFLSKSLPVFARKFHSFAVVQGKAVEYLSTLNEHVHLIIYVNDDVHKDFLLQVEKIKGAGVEIEVLRDALTISKDVRTGQENIYSVFTPFKKTVWNSFVTATVLKKVNFTKTLFAEESFIQQLPRLVTINEEAIFDCFSKARKFHVGGETIDLEMMYEKPNLSNWYCSEDEAIARFKAYLNAGLLDAYNQNRDSLEKDTEVVTVGHTRLEGKTSKMSLALAWGLVSSRVLVKMIKDHFDEPFDNLYSNRVSQGALTYTSELIWREFYRYLLFHRPELMETEFQEKFRGTIEWVLHDEARKRFLLWIKGETGYPIVDAAMHQIARCGWMHNRSRMIVASILTKNFGVNWRWGQEYFRAALIDLDDASNNGGWQWGASVGADPKPIRIFNPYLQAKKFDPSMQYQKKWSESEIFKLDQSQVPIVEHTDAREEALKRYNLKSDEQK